MKTSRCTLIPNLQSSIVMKNLFLVAFLAVAALARGEDALADRIVLAGHNASFLVKMTSSINAATSKVGDKITAVVIVPASLRGGRVEGTVDRADHAILHFSFHTLRFRGQTCAMHTDLTSVVSSKGNAGQDDLGQRVRMDGGGVIAYGVTTAIDEGAEIRFVAWQ